MFDPVTNTVRVADRELEIRATVGHALGARPSISFYRGGSFVMSIERDSPKAKRWSWEMPKREQMRWLELARRVILEVDAHNEARRLADKPVT